MKIKEKNDEGYSGQSKAEEIKNCESLSIDLGRTENKKQRSDLNESSTPIQFLQVFSRGPWEAIDYERELL